MNNLTTDLSMQFKSTRIKLEIKNTSPDMISGDVAKLNCYCCCRLLS